MPTLNASRLVAPPENPGESSTKSAAVMVRRNDACDPDGMNLSETSGSRPLTCFTTIAAASFGLAMASRQPSSDAFTKAFTFALFALR